MEYTINLNEFNLKLLLNSLEAAMNETTKDRLADDLSHCYVMISRQKVEQDNFALAISKGMLSDKQEAVNYAGNYMFMGYQDDHAAFKHVMTREYVYLPLL